ncbi:hypothetical protein A3I30_00975 [Candidatus Azambacteria bacterium RIFCSPLOWO2_02_FULL_44_14]|uniref:Lactamase n=1 Tax=Candidatus Azambacteria bacterium RIFCSPLOWO2_02_FULL_44_14 TaxID=1797306 RepID=A0A1F5CB71_9BACT|nr:MAG: hypothetical protein A3I30_00975 [Candidatus Azambacteria bacterium RIFCSPLOWO2_02_FULL_44_14]
MTISWYGEACFLLEAGGVRILTDPPSSDTGLAAPRLKADILILSKPADVPGASSEAFVIADPGEYEIKDVSVRGVSVPIKNKPHTVYLIEMDGIKIAHLGYLAEELSSEQLEALKDPDIIILPVGGEDVLDTEAAAKVIKEVEPRLVVPSLFSVKGLKRKAAPLSEFMKEVSAKEQPQPKLTIKKKDLDPETTKIFPLEQI